MSYETDEIDETDETDPDVKKEFFKEHFDFVDFFNSNYKKNDFTKKEIYLVTTLNMTCYFHKKIDALYYIQTTVNCIYDKLYEKYKGIKDIFIVKDKFSNVDSNTSIYTRNKNYLFSYDNLEYKITFIELKEFKNKNVR